ncbi:MAG: hypothetical protein WAO02_09800, partial [Verrucomicrobiia bacterium]
MTGCHRPAFTPWNSIGNDLTSPEQHRHLRPQVKYGQGDDDFIAALEERFNLKNKFRTSTSMAFSFSSRRGGIGFDFPILNDAGVEQGGGFQLGGASVLASR